MRPAVYASVLRNRKSGSRRIQQGDHKFSWRRFFVMIFAGAVLLIPGLVVTIIGLGNSELIDIPGDRVLYKVIGPAALACGVGIMCSAGIYYCCWGLKSPVRNRHSSKHYIKDHAEEQADPLHKEKTSAVPTISNAGDAHITPTTENGDHSPGYDSPSVRHGSNHFHHSQHAHRGSSRSLDERLNKGHHQHSRLRSSSSSSSHHHNHHSHSHHHTKSTDNQVAFHSADAPLARGEGSGQVMDGRTAPRTAAMNTFRRSAGVVVTCIGTQQLTQIRRYFNRYGRTVRNEQENLSSVDLEGLE